MVFIDVKNQSFSLNDAIKPLPTEAQVFLTRGCPNRCGHCKLARNGTLDNELDLEHWQKGFSNLERIGIKTVKIMGGEPSFRDWLPELIDYISTETSLKVAVLTEGSFSDEYGKRLADSGLYGIFCSVDGLEAISGGVKTVEGAVPKSRRGYVTLHKAREWGIPLTAANTVISIQNIKQLPDIVKGLSDDGIYVNLGCIIWSDDDRREFSQPIMDDYKFKPEHMPLIKESMDKLIEMQRDGVKIINHEEYMKDMTTYGINLDWQCKDFIQLRIDADGGLMLCNEYRTDLVNKYNITDIDLHSYSNFIGDWYKTRSEIDCKGCYWSCFLIAKNNLKNGNLEFGYFNK